MSAGSSLPPIHLRIYEVDPRDFGAVADVWVYNDGYINAGELSHVYIGNPAFAVTATAPNNPIVVRGAGAAGADLITTISAYEPVRKMITLNSPSTISGAVQGKFGTDDSGAINRALVANGFANTFDTNPTAPGVPDAPGASGDEGWWQHGPQVVALKSMGRASSLFGALSPIRLTSGCRLRFDTPLAALPGFTGQALVHQQLDAATGTVPREIFEARLITPELRCEGLCANGLMVEVFTDLEIEGNTHVLGATTLPVFFGPTAATISAAAALGTSVRAIIGKFNGSFHLQNHTGAAAVGTNDPASVGFTWGATAYDNTVTGDIHIIGYRTGFVETNGAGNNKVHGTIHAWTGKPTGLFTTGAILAGGNSRYSDIYVDSLCNAAGQTAVGVVTKAPGVTIGTVRSTVNPTVGTLDNQVTLISNTCSSASNPVVIGRVVSQSYTGGGISGYPTSIKFAAVVADTSAGAGLRINDIGGDGNWYAQGYADRIAANASGLAAETASRQALSTTVTALQAVTPGSPWTPAQLPVANLPVWFDAVAGVSVDNTGLVSGIASRSSTVAGVKATTVNTNAATGGSTAPAYSATGFSATMPGITFNGAVNGDMLTLGAPGAVFPNGPALDISVFMVAKRGAQDPTDTSSARRNLLTLFNNNGSTSIKPEVGFYNPTNDAGQTKVRLDTSGGGSTDLTSLASGQAGILEAFFTTDFTPAGSPGVGTSGALTRSNTRTTTATTTALAAGSSPGSVVTLGGDPGYAANRAAFTLGELIIYVGPLADADRQKIRAYLAYKWFGSGQGVLPSSDIYYAIGPLIPPTVSANPVTSSVVSAGSSINVASTVIDYYANKTSSSATTFVLPASPTQGEKHSFFDVKGDAATNNITLSANGNSICGDKSGAAVASASSYTMSTAFQVASVSWNGSFWHLH